MISSINRKRLLASILAALASWYLFVSVYRTLASMETFSPIFGVIVATEACFVNGIVDGCSIAS